MLKEIRGAIRYGDRTFVAGDEDEFEAAITDDDEVDLEALTEQGVLSGFAGEREVEPTIVPDAEQKAALLGVTGEVREKIVAKGPAAAIAEGDIKRGARKQKKARRAKKSASGG